jgi:dTDP-4-amino-4,6-dideoxygalactose transaminase
MIPRKKIDIGWCDLRDGIRFCFSFGHREAMQRRLEELWCPNSGGFACLSLRSGFDLVLQALELPRGSEVLVSALNVRSMFDVLRHHGLVPVPIDLDTSTMAMKPEVLQEAVSDKTRAILVAHLLGSRFPMEGVLQFARRHGLFVFEDCAQAFTGDDYRGHPESDVSMFSFGPIKTCSTIMGGMLRVRDESLLEKARSLQARQRVHNRWDYFGLLCRFAVIKMLSTRPLFTVVSWTVRCLRLEDTALNDQIRIFGGRNEFKRFRQQPCYPMLALLDRRLRRFDVHAIERRTAVAQTLNRLMPQFRRPGEKATFHTYWIYPVIVSDPQRLMKYLRRRGFDSIDRYSSFIPAEPAEGYEQFQATEVRETMKQVLYLPAYDGLSDRDLQRLAEAVVEFENSHPRADDAPPCDAAPQASQTPAADSASVENPRVHAGTRAVSRSYDSVRKSRRAV